MFVKNKLRIGAVAAVFTDQDKFLVSNHSIAAPISCFFDLVSEIDVVVIQKPNLLSVGQYVFEIHIVPVQQIEIRNGQPFDVQCIDFSINRSFSSE